MPLVERTEPKKKKKNTIDRYTDRLNINKEEEEKEEELHWMDKYSYTQTSNMVKLTGMPQRSWRLVTTRTAAAREAAEAPARSAAVAATCLGEATFIVDDDSCCDSSSTIVVLPVMYVYRPEKKENGEAIEEKRERKRKTNYGLSSYIWPDR